MKYTRTIMSLLFFTLLATATMVLPLADAQAAPPYGKVTYDPSMVYPGDYESDVAYTRYPKSSWRQGLNGTISEAIVCQDALKSLRQTGLWRGNFGLGGTCGPLGEPAEWALGNRLNFNEQFSAD
ncbi:MAG: hypothetical protein EG822_03400 [Deltaproteobacteria bacterium]|nr:hypothetical protein [Deltaproteobacteria bacterium]TLN05144.1 MAG: hypothetical protein FDZ73_00460 [bacterium]